MSHRWLIAALFAACPASISAQSTAPDAPKPESQETIVVTGKIPDADKRVCRTDVTTGSIIPKRTCRTKGEWEAIRARSIAAAERMKSEQDRRRHTQESVENQ